MCRTNLNNNFNFFSQLKTSQPWDNLGLLQGWVWSEQSLGNVLDHPNCPIIAPHYPRMLIFNGRAAKHNRSSFLPTVPHPYDFGVSSLRTTARYKTWKFPDLIFFQWNGSVESSWDASKPSDFSPHSDVKFIDLAPISTDPCQYLYSAL